MDGQFNLVICDPPHDKYGKTSYMAIKYGSWSEEEFACTMAKANKEFWRVLQKQGLLLLKIQSNRRDTAIAVLNRFKLLLEIEAIRRSYHNKSGLRTYWLLFMRRAEA